MKFTITLNDGTKKQLINKNNHVIEVKPKRNFFIRQFDGTKKMLMKENVVVAEAKPRENRNFFIRQFDGSKKLLNKNTVVVAESKPKRNFFIRQFDGSKKLLNKEHINKSNSNNLHFHHRLGKQVVIHKSNGNNFHHRLGREVVINKKIEEIKIHFQLVLQREKIFKKDWFDHDKKIITNKKGTIIQEEVITQTYFDKKK